MSLALSMSMGAVQAATLISNNSAIALGSSHATVTDVIAETQRLQNQSILGGNMIKVSNSVQALQEKNVSSTSKLSKGQSLNVAKSLLQNSIAASTGGHKSLGDRMAEVLRNADLPDELVIFLLSAMPVVELRAGVPIGFLLGLHPAKVFILAVLGNIAPIIPLMLLLRIRIVQTLAARVLNRARSKAASMGTSDSRAMALTLFVGLPLPGTGAWTGSLVAFVLGMPIGQTLLSLFAGVIMAACIMTILCAMGKLGAVVAGSVLLAGGISSIMRLGAKRELEGGNEDTAVSSPDT